MMSKWVFQYNYDIPCVSCEDIGNLRSFKLLDKGRAFSASNDFDTYIVYGQMMLPRRTGRVPMRTQSSIGNSVARNSKSVSFDMFSVGKIIAESDIQGFLGANTFVRAYCIDPRILALVDASVDLMALHAKKEEYERLYKKIPTKIKAEEYLRASGFTFGKWFTQEELEIISPPSEWSQSVCKVGAISILLD